MLIVTRQTIRLLKKYGITREPVVVLERNFKADSLGYLNKQSANPAQIQSRRRVSVASTSLFNIGNQIREAGFDFFQRIPRSTEVNLGASTSGTGMLNASMAINGINCGASNNEATSAVVQPIEPIEPNDANDIFGDEIETLYWDEAETHQTGANAMVESNELFDFDEEIESLYWDDAETDAINAMNIEPNEPFDFGDGIESVCTDNAMPNENHQTNAFYPFGEQIDRLYQDEDIPYSSNEVVDTGDTLEHPAVPANSNDATIAMIEPNNEKEQQESRKLQNDFDPFCRLENVPFSVTGRPRAISVSANFAPQPIRRPSRPRRLSCIAVPSLDTIPEEDDILPDIANLYI